MPSLTKGITGGACVVVAGWAVTINAAPNGVQDINGDGVVNVLDILEVLAAWGPC